MCCEKRDALSSQVICGSESVARVSFKRGALTMRTSTSAHIAPANKYQRADKKEAASRRPKLVVSKSLSQSR
jgi:hypothetical protein